MKPANLQPDKPTPPLRNKKLWKSIEELRLIELKNRKARVTAKRPKSGAVCSNADLFVGDKKRGSIYFSVGPAGYHATLMPIADFFRFEAPSEKALVRQIIDWFSREYIGATDIEVRSKKKCGLCSMLNKRLVAFCTSNERHKVKPAGRTLSNAHIPTKKGDDHARIH